jgi:hypothetical protein
MMLQSSSEHPELKVVSYSSEDYFDETDENVPGHANSGGYAGISTIKR